MRKKEKYAGWPKAMSAIAVTYIAIQEQLDGKVVDWMEPVSDEHYQGRWWRKNVPIWNAKTGDKTNKKRRSANAEAQTWKQ